MDAVTQIESPLDSPHTRIGIAILAGGASRRMGADKKNLKLGDRTYLEALVAAATGTDRLVEVVEKDIVPAAGPLSGILTALSRHPGRPFLFLPCDTPLVTTNLLLVLLAQITDPSRAHFHQSADRHGFPFFLPATALDLVHAKLQANDLSLQSLARSLDPIPFHLSDPQERLLLNANTPGDHERISRLWNSERP